MSQGGRLGLNSLVCFEYSMSATHRAPNISRSPRPAPALTSRMCARPCGPPCRRDSKVSTIARPGRPVESLAYVPNSERGAIGCSHTLYRYICQPFDVHPMTAGRLACSSSGSMRVELDHKLEGSSSGEDIGPRNHAADAWLWRGQKSKVVGVATGHLPSATDDLLSSA